MDTPLPFGLPYPTAFYLSIYVATLVIHVLFMNYVLAGTGYLAACGLLGAQAGRQPIKRILKDWLPAMLSGAITAGIAPLMFVQILYKQSFYTANLLLFHRWMSILPTLIVGFYALYLLKSEWLRRQPNVLVVAVSIVPFLAFGFTAYSWTENHLLSVRDQAYWSEFYKESTPFHQEPQLLPRLMIWTFGSLPTLAVVLGWQLRYRQLDESVSLGRLALVGLALAGSAAIVYTITAPQQAAVCVGPMALPYFVAAVIGAAIQAYAWTVAVVRKEQSTKNLTIASIGLGITIVGMAVCREAIRLDTIGGERLARLLPLHAKANEISGFALFVAFLVINTGLIAFCFVLVRTGKKTTPMPEVKIKEVEFELQ